MNAGSRKLMVWGIAGLSSLMLTIINIGIPIFSTLSRIETKLTSVAEAQASMEDRLERSVDRLNRHIQDTSTKGEVR